MTTVADLVADDVASVSPKRRTTYAIGIGLLGRASADRRLTAVTFHDLVDACEAVLGPRG
jgi:hypothetical protein